MEEDLKKALRIIFIIFIFFISLIIYRIYLDYSDKTVTVETIKEVTIEIISSGNWTKRLKYLFTNENTYEIEDKLLIFHTNSMDVYRRLKINEWKECKLTTIWHRIWFFSMYKSVIDLDCE